MLSDFSSKLARRLQANDRPFVCEGNPFACSIAIVGTNPATEMQASFWDFWSDESGFDKERWLEIYKEERKTKPFESGKTRRNKLSATRRSIEWICEAAKPSSILETNVYAKPTSTDKELKEKDRVNSLFEFLITNIEPKILLLHGKPARQHVEKILVRETELVENEIQNVHLFGVRTVSANLSTSM